MRVGAWLGLKGRPSREMGSRGGELDREMEDDEGDEGGDSNSVGGANIRKI
jgi:hypothetical protein